MKNLYVALWITLCIQSAALCAGFTSVQPKQPALTQKQVKKYQENLDIYQGEIAQGTMTLDQAISKAKQDLAGAFKPEQKAIHQKVIDTLETKQQTNQLIRDRKKSIDSDFLQLSSEPEINTRTLNITETPTQPTSIQIQPKPIVQADIAEVTQTPAKVELTSPTPENNILSIDSSLSPSTSKRTVTPEQRLNTITNKLRAKNFTIEQLQEKIAGTDSPTYKQALKILLAEAQAQQPSLAQAFFEAQNAVLGLGIDAGTSATQAIKQTAISAQQKAAQAKKAVLDTANEITEKLTALKDDVIEVGSDAVQSVHQAAANTAYQGVNKILGIKPREKFGIPRTNSQQNISKKGIIPTEQINAMEKAINSDSSSNVPQVKSQSIIDYMTSMLQAGGQKIMKTPQGARQLAETVAQAAAELMGYPKVIKGKFIIEQAVQEAQTISEQSPQQFRTSSQRWVANIIKKIFIAMKQDAPENIQTIIISNKEQSLTSPKIQITYNNQSNNIKSVMINYQKRSYTIDPQSYKIENNQLIITEAPLLLQTTLLENLTNAALQKGANFLTKTAMKGTDASVQTMAQKIFHASLPGPKTEGSINLTLELPKTPGPIKIVSQKITTINSDGSYITTEFDGKGTKTIIIDDNPTNRRSPETTIVLNQSGVPAQIKMVHNFINEVDGKTKSKTYLPETMDSSYDAAEQNFQFVAKFPDDTPANLIDVLKYAQGKVIETSTNVLFKGVMESDGTQNLRRKNPQLKQAINTVQDFIIAPIAEHLEYNLGTYNIKTGKIITYTIKIRSDNSREVTRVAYPPDTDFDTFFIIDEGERTQNISDPNMFNASASTSQIIKTLESMYTDRYNSRAQS